MAHTVQTLSKLLKKTPGEVVAILKVAGIDNKQINSEISTEERKILMGSLSKRSGNKSSIAVSRRPSTKLTASTLGGVKVQVKKKRVQQEPAKMANNAVDKEAAAKAQQALEAARIADEKLSAQDAKRLEMIRLQQAQAQKTQQEVTKQPEVKPADTDKKKPKRLRTDPATKPREQLHVAHKTKRKLKKKELQNAILLLEAR